MDWRTCDVCAYIVCVRFLSTSSRPLLIFEEVVFCRADGRPCYLPNLGVGYVYYRLERGERPPALGANLRFYVFSAAVTEGAGAKYQKMYYTCCYCSLSLPVVVA